MPSTAVLMDGTSLSGTVLAKAALRAAAFYAHAGRRPYLAIVLVGHDPASRKYAEMKRARCHDVGVETRLIELSATATTAQVVGVLARLSHDPLVDGILFHYPAPQGVDERAAFEAIAPAKDVDGATKDSFAAMALGLRGFIPCAAAGIMRLLEAYDVDPSSKHAVVLGQSSTLATPIAMLLLSRHGTVTLCHVHAEGLADLVRSADIVIAAVGIPELVRGNWIKPGAVVVDAGYCQGPVGDVAVDEVRHVARLIAPVPGGVGPMTIAVLIEQTVRAAEGATCGVSE